MKYFYPLLFALIFTTSFQAYAQCTMPNGQPNAEMGVIVFNKAHKVMQYCNGDDWIGIWGGGGGGGGVQRVSGEVVAFDLAVCPEGWSEYLPARGRFIRGIDNGANNDPDGTRMAGQIQGDALQGHAHEIFDNSGTAGVASGSYVNVRHRTGATVSGIVRNPVSDGNNGTPRIANETRPKNVSLLYCRKN